jgi:tRNA A22 N-methylase
LFAFPRLQENRHISNSSKSNNATQASDDNAVALLAAHDAFSLIAKRKKSWKRLGHLVNLAASTGLSRTIADVGTDHGLLAIGLALSGRFVGVLGVDISQKALDGGIALWENVQTKCEDAESEDSISIDFRQSDGLQKVKTGEADVVCIAGMGVNTMLKILKSDRDSILHLDRINCQQLLLQATNSRPSNLILLYDHLQSSGWKLIDERIEYVSSRWYVSSHFSRAKENESFKQSPKTFELPTAKVAKVEKTEPMYDIFKDYVNHHCNWIEQDAAFRGRIIRESDQRWLAEFGGNATQNRN